MCRNDYVNLVKMPTRQSDILIASKVLPGLSKIKLRSHLDSSYIFFCFYFPLGGKVGMVNTGW